jgi:hypothetical protein
MKKRNSAMEIKKNSQTITTVFYSTKHPPEQQIHKKIKSLEKKFFRVEINSVKINQYKTFTIFNQYEPVDVFQVFIIFKCF